MPSNLLNELPGLTKSKLTLATATENDVVTGKTFYSGDKTLQTGSLSDIGRSIDVLYAYNASSESAVSFSRTVSDS